MIGDDAVKRMRQEAVRVRRAIEATDLSDCECTLSDFPRRCCHHGTKILAYHFWESGWTDLKVASGQRNRKPFHEHVWLQVVGITIDITADQFGKSRPPVIVRRRSPWHEAWKPKLEALDQKRLTGWRTHEGEVFDAYRKVMAALRSEARQ